MNEIRKKRGKNLNQEEVDQILQEMGIKNYNVNNKKLLKYDYPLTEETSSKIVEDAVNNFKEWGIDYPEVNQAFLQSGGIDYSGVYKNILGLGIYIQKIPQSL